MNFMAYTYTLWIIVKWLLGFKDFRTKYSSNWLLITRSLDNTKFYRSRKIFFNLENFSYIFKVKVVS